MTKFLEKSWFSPIVILYVYSPYFFYKDIWVSFFCVAVFLSCIYLYFGQNKINII